MYRWHRRRRLEGLRAARRRLVAIGGGASFGDLVAGIGGLIEQFDGYRAIEELVDGSEDAAHAAVADRLFEQVASAEALLRLNLHGHRYTGRAGCVPRLFLLTMLAPAMPDVYSSPPCLTALLATA